MAQTKYTVIYEKDGISYKICKVIFGPDGSYYVTCPYHSESKAVLAKVTFNYASHENRIAVGDALDVAVANDDKRRVKLSHHLDGLVQFSGHGIVSGINEQGVIRGIGVMSWPLTQPTSGPAFGIAVSGVERFVQEHRSSGNRCIFRHSEIVPMPNAAILFLNGYYFPPLWRRFVRHQPDGTHSVSIIHPAGAVVSLKVLYAPASCAWPGFIGLELWTDSIKGPGTPFAFSLSGSSGNIRRNADGELLGDGIVCAYPHPEWIIPQRSLDFERTYLQPKL
jgi:hypothetical protein